VRKPSIAAIGAGRLARALLPRLREAGYRVTAVEDAGVVLLAVPDRRIEEVARDLARARVDLSRKVFLHHAGSLGPEPLRALARRGAAAGVLHPFQVLSDARVAASILPGSFARIEGDRRAVAAARRIAKDLGLVPFRLPRPLRPKDRAAYHAAASLVSNDLVALLSLASRALAKVGIDRTQALRALASLARGTLAHAEQGGLDAALTGPVARGDASTVEAQLRSLRLVGRGAAEAHRLLAGELLALAVEGRRLSRADAAALRRILARGSRR